MTKKLQSPFYLKISTKLIISIILIALLPLILLRSYSFFQYQKTTEESIIESLILASEAYEGQLLIYLNNIKNRTVDFSSDGFIRDKTKILVNDYENKEAVEELNTHLINNKMFLDETLSGINIISLEGKIIASTNENEIGDYEGDDDYFINTINSSYGTAQLSDIKSVNHFGSEHRAIVVSSILVDKDNGEKLGVIANYFTINVINSILSGDYQMSLGSLTGKKGRGETVNVYLVNKDKVMITLSRFLGDESYFKQNVNTNPVNRCLDNDEEISGKWFNYRGEKVFGSSSCLKNYFNWTLILEIDETEILEPVYNLKKVISVTMGGLVLLIILMGSYLGKIFTKPIERLSELSQRIAQGENDIKIPAFSRDEIGELSKNVISMSQAIQKSKNKIEDNLEILKKQKNNLEDQQRATINILEDVAEEKDKSEFLAEDLKKFKLAVENSAEQVVITDPEGTIIYINNATSKVTGFSKEESIGKKAGSSELWGGQMEAAFYKKLWKVIKKDKKVFNGEFNNVRKNGEKYIAESHVSPITNSKGDVIFFVAIERDISKAKEIDKMKTEFISLASHQLRTPLSAMKWFLEMLLAGDAGKLNKEQKNMLVNINSSNERMIELVNSLLNISRIESGRIIIDPEPTDLKQLVDEVIMELRPKIVAKKHNLIISASNDLPKINIDPKLIRQVYMNLLTNAIKYTDDKGEIIVMISKKDKKIISQISDNGLGIPQKNNEKLFKKFFRAENVLKKDTEGNGLGLYLVKAIIESSLGKIWFESKEGEGTTFWFSLPVSGSPAQKGEVKITS